MLINALLRAQENDEDLLGPEVPYLSVITTLMYLANYTWRDIAFAVNLLRYSSSPTRKQWIGVKNILCYLKGTMNMKLFYPNDSKLNLMDYANACYLLYSQNVTMVYHEQDIYSHVVAEWFHDDMWKRP